MIVHDRRYVLHIMCIILFMFLFFSIYYFHLISTSSCYSIIYAHKPGIVYILCHVVGGRGGVSMYESSWFPWGHGG